MLIVLEAKTGEDLFDGFVDLLKGQALEQLEQDIVAYIEKLVRRPDHEISKLLISRLYFFQVMHNGCTVFENDGDDAINAGFAYLVKSDSGMFCCSPCQS